MRRRRLALALALGGVGMPVRAQPVVAAAPADAAPALVPRPLVLPRDHGAHPDTRIEWWYVTGALALADPAGTSRDDTEPDAPPTRPAFGFQLTFFRSRTGLAGTNPSRFAPRQLLFAHAALTDLAGGRLHHAERIARWNGDPGAALASASLDDLRLDLGRWRLARDAADGRLHARVDSASAAQAGDERSAFAFDFGLTPTQPPLLQGDAGFSRKGPLPAHASFYVSQPQLALRGSLAFAGRSLRVHGRAWLDHEWSQSLMPDDAVGWDWIGINLDDGGALTAFVLRRADASPVWAGGSLRARGASKARDFGATEVRMAPGRLWTSPRTGARYPVEWTITTPAGTHSLVALLDDQELDSRASTGAIYWEGLSELRDGSGARIGLGYLEMTGRAGRLRL